MEQFERDKNKDFYPDLKGGIKLSKRMLCSLTLKSSHILEDLRDLFRQRYCYRLVCSYFFFTLIPGILHAYDASV